MIKKVNSIPDLFITLPVIFLLSLGVLVIYSSDPKLALQQTIFVLIGILLYWSFSFFDFESLGEYIKYLYIIILGLLVVVFLLGIETRGSLRWIPLMGLQLQPSEFAKPIVILLLANFWSSRLPSWKNILKSFLWVVPAAGLIFKQPDLGTTLTILMIWLMMLIGANISATKLALMGMVSLVFAPIAWFLLKGYQRDRIFSFLSPTRDPLGIGYNVIQSTIAVGSGEFMGRGLGRGTQSRLRFLPEFRTDFMFASIAEEFGFIGSALVLILYGTIIGQSFRVINRTGNRFHSLLVFGVLGMLFFQIIVNMGMNLGIVPITGITLPLLSYGGSSLIATMICLGFVASASRFARGKIEDNND
ncbi:MAG: rod shape-determining protein RodA [Patescibacteria group bacterium]|nr:rod shape-determining protein RodA [Patescibacteria group bacterium]